MGTVAGPTPQVASYLRGMTRGWYALGSVVGIAGGVWGGRWVGQAVFRLRRCTDPIIPTLPPGLTWSECKLGEPALSWFVLPGPCHVGDPTEQAVQALFASVGSLGASPELPDLIAHMVIARVDLAHNVTPVCPSELMQPCSKSHVLPVDQRCGGGATQATFIRVVAATQSEYPDTEIWIWPTARGAAGGLSGIGELPTGTRRIAAGFNFFATLSHIDHAYAVNAPEDMQALLADIPVYALSHSYYAGWGLTTDDFPMPDRRYHSTLTALLDTVCLRLMRYLDPEIHGVGTLKRSFDNTGLQYMVRVCYTDCERVAGVHFQLWKRFFTTLFLTVGGSRLRRAHVPEKMEQGERMALWGDKSTEGILASASMSRMEDGSLRSDGFGSDINAPCSQVLDREGLYFDTRTPGELAYTLNNAQFDDVEPVRATALRELMACLDVTKYNLGRRTPDWNAPTDKTVILIAGQVADDASICYGTEMPGMAEASLEAVRKRSPGGFVAHKLHPDVLSSNRQGLAHAHELADTVGAESDVVSLVDYADGMHALSSLVGLDALLRGKRVFTYGLPFYVGQGLAQDTLEQP